MALMGKDLDLEGLKIVFRRATALPQLPGGAIRLLKAIDSGEASASDLERIITCDAALTANLLRLANSADSGLPSGITTIRSAILRLGQRTVRSMGVSLTIQALLSSDAGSGGFSARRYARHCVASGFLCRYLFVRKKQGGDFETAWAAEEAFSAGLMHDLGHALLSRVVPSVYAVILGSAEMGNISFPEAFRNMYGASVGVLGEVAAKTWNLPESFIPAIRYCDSPSESEDELQALYCLNYADYLANEMGASIEPWAVQGELDPMVEAEVALPEEELKVVLDIIDSQTDNYISGAGCIAA
jgi:HD-like signal output (HDOD) protein